MFFVGILAVDVSTYVLCIFVSLFDHAAESHKGLAWCMTPPCSDANRGSDSFVVSHVDKSLDPSVAPCQCKLLGFDSRNTRT
jgi:hypothetical protein